MNEESLRNTKESSGFLLQELQKLRGIGRQGIIQLAVVSEFHQEATKEV